MVSGFPVFGGVLVYFAGPWDSGEGLFIFGENSFILSNVSGVTIHGINNSPCYGIQMAITPIGFRSKRDESIVHSNHFSLFTDTLFRFIPTALTSDGYIISIYSNISRQNARQDIDYPANDS